MSKRGTLAAGVALCLTGAALAVELSRAPGLTTQTAPDGALWLRLEPGMAGEATVPLVAGHRGDLRVTDGAGHRLELPILPLEAGRGSRSSGLLAPRVLLEQGIWLRESAAALPLPLRNAAEPDPWARHAFARLEVEGQGLIRVTGRWLAEHVEGPLPDPATWSLVHNGVPEPFHMTGDGDGVFDLDDELVFWAEPTTPDVPELGADTRQDPWSRREVWFLASDGSPGPRLAQESGEIVETDPSRYTTPLTFPATVHVEEENHFSRLTYVLDEPHPDHHLWTTGIYGGTLRTVTFDAPGLYPYSLKPVEMTVCLRGLSAPAEEGEPDVFQRVRLYVNSTGGQALEVGAAGDWRNQELMLAHFGAEAFPDHSPFVAGRNALVLAGVDEAPAGTWSSCMLNWLDLTYEREFRAVGDQLLFTAEPSLDGRVVNFEVAGFTTPDIRVYKLGRSVFRSVIVRPLGGGHRLRLQDGFTAGTRYVAATEASLREPDAAERVTPRGLASITAGAAAVVVVADSLWRSGAAELLAPVLETIEGGALVVSDRQVYDEFSHGKTRPHAIRDFLRRAWRQWAVPPRWALLVGDGAPASRQVTTGVEPVLPLMYEQAYKWGAASSDDWFAREEDGIQLPVVVSRWPAATPADLANLAAKAQAYSQAAEGPWSNSLLLAAGARAQDEGVFMDLTEAMLQLKVQPRFFVRRLYAGEEGGAYIGSRPDLVELVNQGQLLVNYSGHGGGAVWEDNNLFSSQDVPLLDNAERLAFFTNATCFIASLDYPGSLGRTLLNTPEVGAIGVVGSTGLGFRDTGMELVAEFWELVLHNPGLETGRALREAKQRLWLRRAAGHEGTLEAKYVHAVNVMNTLLGLPWQTLALPAETESRVDNPAPEAGGLLRVSGEGARPGGTGRLEVYSDNTRALQTGPDFARQVLQVPVTVDASGSWSAQLALPDSLPGGGRRASLRAWVPVADSPHGASGVTWFHPADSLSSALVWRARLLPDPPRPATPLAVEVRAVSPAPLDSLVALLRVTPLGGAEELLRLSLSPATGDPQRWVAPPVLGPYADSTLVGLRFVLHDADGPDSTTTSWYWVEAARPGIQWSLLAGLDAQGRRPLLVSNGGDGASDSLEALLTGAPGGDLAFRLPPLAPGATLQASLPRLVGQAPGPLRLTASWNQRAGGAHPGPLEFSQEAVCVPAGVWVAVAGDSIQLRHDEPGRVLAARRVDPDSVLMEQTGRVVFDGPWRLEWLDGAPAGTVLGVIRRDGLAETELPDAGLLQWLESPGLLLLMVDGDVDHARTGDSLRVEFRLDGADGFALGRLDDLTPPVTQLEVEGQVFDSGGFVPPTAAFSWSLTDAGGLDPRRGRIWLTLDDDSVSTRELSLLADPSGGQLGLRWQLDGGLARGGLHTLHLRAMNAAGVWAQLHTEFRVGERLDLEYLGTYPNPFQRETRFVFSLSGVADAARIDIYTVAGRRIRRLEIPGPLINYVETIWDGRDHVGDVVANGVYFYRLTAQGAEGRVERTGTVARLK
jgi:hypothetical protein